MKAVPGRFARTKSVQTKIKMHLMQDYHHFKGTKHVAPEHCHVWAWKELGMPLLRPARGKSIRLIQYINLRYEAKQRPLLSIVERQYGYCNGGAYLLEGVGYEVFQSLHGCSDQEHSSRCKVGAVPLVRKWNEVADLHQAAKCFANCPNTWSLW